MTSKIISTFGGVEPISTHAWSADGKNLAISHNNKAVKVYKQSTKPGKWEATATLDQHDLRVTGKIFRIEVKFIYSEKPQNFAKSTKYLFDWQ